MATDLCCSHDRIVGARFAGNGVAKPVKGVVTLVLNTQYTGHAHSWGGEEIRRCQAGNALLVSKRGGSNFLQEEIGWNGGLRLLPEETAGASTGIRCGGSFYAEQHPRHASSPSSLLVGPSHARHTPTTASHAQRAVTRPPRCSMPATVGKHGC